MINGSPPRNPNDLVDALQLAHQLRKVLPARMAEAIVSELTWSAGQAHLVGRERYLRLAQEVRDFVRAAGAARPEAAA